MGGGGWVVAKQNTGKGPRNVSLPIFMNQKIKRVSPAFTPPSLCEYNFKYDLTQKR